MKDRVPGTIAWFIAAVLLGLIATVDVANEKAIAEDDRRGVVRSVNRDGTVKVEAEDASLSHIIEELSRTVGFEVDGDAPNEDMRLTRSLEGTLDELLAKLLRDGNFVLLTDDGVPKRLILLPSSRPDSDRSQPPPTPQPITVSAEQLRQKESDLLVLIARYEDMSEEAREHANPEFAKKFKTYARHLAREVEAVRERLTATPSNMR